MFWCCSEQMYFSFLAFMKMKSATFQSVCVAFSHQKCTSSYPSSPICCLMLLIWQRCQNFIPDRLKKKRIEVFLWPHQKLSDATCCDRSLMRLCINKCLQRFMNLSNFEGFSGQKFPSQKRSQGQMMYRRKTFFGGFPHKVLFTTQHYL